MESDFLKSSIGRSVRDFLWDDYIHYRTWFESLDAIDELVGGSGALGAEHDRGLVVNTGTTADSYAWGIKRPRTWPGIPGWKTLAFFDHNVRFQSALAFDSDTNQRGEHVWGDARDNDANRFGLLVVDDDLYLKTADGSASNTVSLITGFTAQLNLWVEAELFPGSKVTAKVVNVDTGDEYTAESTSNLPSGDPGEASWVLSTRIENTAAESKQIFVPTHEIWSPRWGK